MPIPEELQRLHRARLEILQREIITDQSAASAYDYLDNYWFFEVGERERLRIAFRHVMNLARLYDVGTPYIGTFEKPAEEKKDGQKLGVAMRVVTMVKSGVYSPVILMNKAMRGEGLYESLSLNFLQSVSHEFAHYIELLLVGAIKAGEVPLETEEKWDSRQIQSRKDHFLHNRSMALPFSINQGCYYGGWERYVDGLEDLEIYQAQIKERHANWFGRECMVAVLDARGILKDLSDLPKYRKDILYKMEWARNQLGSESLYDDLREFLDRSEASFFALESQDRRVLVEAGSQIIEDFYNHIAMTHDREKDLSSEKRKFECASRLGHSNIQTARLMRKAVTEWLPPSDPDPIASRPQSPPGP